MYRLTSLLHRSMSDFVVLSCVVPTSNRNCRMTSFTKCGPLSDRLNLGDPWVAMTEHVRMRIIPYIAHTVQVLSPLRGS